MPDPRPSILITGASGGLASTLVDLLLEDYRLVGADPRPLSPGTNFPGEFHQVDYTHRRMAEVFRQHRFHALLHLGRIRVDSAASNASRYNLNVLGTRSLLDLARKYGVKQVIVFSTFHVYGAHPLNPLHLSEDDPLRASQTFPELVDAVEMDHAATTFLLKYPQIRTVVLRPVNVVGPRIKNTVAQVLREKYCPTVLGYDPPQQFVHERDVARALKLTLQGSKSGIYNLAGEGVVPYSKAIEICGGLAVPVPAPLGMVALSLLSRVGVGLPAHLLDYFRYPTIVTDSSFRREFGYEPEFTTVEALKSLKSGRRELK